ncbi:steroid hormone receptor ERR1-like isoform X2 [Tigriopus californicus]|uniref:steroid hormone receptor ERR1-like isoform X2 n=1 Tax=Tigriopus californicus TaxID=6832 RepID=UPI0027DA3B41|nr:steroid hormone receptor ERR1-like isoform X2 [Tigriopus californicus]
MAFPSASRLIVCKLGRFGELRKVFDKTADGESSSDHQGPFGTTLAPKPTWTNINFGMGCPPIPNSEKQTDSMTNDGRTKSSLLSLLLESKTLPIGSLVTPKAVEPPVPRLPPLPPPSSSPASSSPFPSPIIHSLTANGSSDSLSDLVSVPMEDVLPQVLTDFSEVQVLNSSGGMLLTDQVKKAILSLGVGEKIRLMDVPEMGTETSEDSLSGSGFDFLPGELVQPDLVLTPHPDFGSKNNGPTPSTGARACNSSNEDKMDYSESQSSPLSSDQNSPKEIKLFEGDNNLALQTHLRQFSSLDGSTTGSTLVRPSSPESPDQHHCSSTTQPIMDRHHLLSADSIKDEDGPKRICLVCGDVASGFHYGVSSCEACKAFFKRTIQGNIEYTCPASSDCEINKRRRKACQACRFQKCLRMGMLKEGVRLDRVRGGRQKYRRMIESPYGGLHPARKLSLEENKLLIALTRCEPEPLLALPDPNLPDDQYKTLTTLSEFYDRELVGTIGWAKQIPGFGDLSLYDQMRLLHFSWSEILTLTLVFRSLPRTGRLNFAADFALTEAQANNCGLQDFFHHCSRTIERLERLGMRKEEFLILKAIVICNCDVRVEEQSALWRLRDNLLSALYDCVAVIRSGNPAIHVQNILLLLPSIRQADGLVRQFWGKVQASGKLQLNKLLVEMLEAQSSK